MYKCIFKSTKGQSTSNFILYNEKLRRVIYMITISLCMIVKNEEDVIERCLKSVKNIADEIIIVDTGSKDSTKEICRRYTDKIYNFK